MKNNIIRLVVLSIFLPMLAFAQTTDVDTSSTNSCAVISQNLRYLSRDTNGSSDVSILQDFLNSKGYLKSQPTGFFGSATRKAVIAFQNDNGLRATPPGFVGAGTRAKIQVLDCGNNTSVNTSTSNTNASTHSVNSNDYSKFVSFIYPSSNEKLSVDTPNKIRWNPISNETKTKFKGFSMALEIIDSAGNKIGSIGDGYSLNETSAVWNIKPYLDSKFYTLKSDENYKIRANLGSFMPSNLSLGCDPAMPYGPKDCAPLYSEKTKQLIQDAKNYVSDSAQFTVDMSKYRTQTATIDQNTLNSLSGTVTVSGETSLEKVQFNIRQGNNLIASYVKIPSVNGKWSYSISLQAGTYDVDIWNVEGSMQLAVGTLVVR